MAHLPDDATIADRKKALRAHAYEFHGGTSWGKKVWSKHCKIYLARFGPVVPQKPFQFGDDIIFPFRRHPGTTSMTHLFTDDEGNIETTPKGDHP